MTAKARDVRTSRRWRSAIHAAMLVLVTGLAGCGDAELASTSVPGSVGGGPRPAAAAPLTDSSGRAIPAPPALPRNAQVQIVRSGPDAALALWVQDDRVVTASWTPASGWVAPVPLEAIHGEATRPQLAGNGQGIALAVWQHTVGSIQSLRFSRFDASGWSLPDVMPGALPRPPAGPGHGDDAGPQLHMDAQGNAFAQWPSGFAVDEVQTARYVAGRGWTRALSEPITAAVRQPGTSVQ